MKALALKAARHLPAEVDGAQVRVWVSLFPQHIELLDHRAHQVRATRSSCVRTLLELDSLHALLPKELTQRCRKPEPLPDDGIRTFKPKRVCLGLYPQHAARLEARSAALHLSQSVVIQMLVMIDAREGLIPREMVRRCRAERAGAGQEVRHAA